MSLYSCSAYSGAGIYVVRSDTNAIVGSFGFQGEPILEVYGFGSTFVDHAVVGATYELQVTAGGSFFQCTAALSGAYINILQASCNI